MAAVPWDIVLFSPLGMTLASTSTLFFVFIMMLITRTPAMTFLKAGFGRKIILVNTEEDKTLSFRIAKKERSLADVKKRGKFLIDPNDVHLERASKVPCAMVYGNFGVSLDGDTAVVADKLKQMGINNYRDLILEEISAGEARKRNIISETEYNKEPNKRYEVKRQTLPEKLTLNGRSISFENVIDYFSKNVRADWIESEIQWRTSSEVAKKLSGPQDIFKWAIILAIILIAGALAYNMIAMGGADAVAQGVGGVVGQGSTAIGGTGLS